MICREVGKNIQNINQFDKNLFYDCYLVLYYCYDTGCYLLDWV